MTKKFKAVLYTDVILTFPICLGSLLVFLLSIIIDRFEPHWMMTISFFSALFSSEIRDLFICGETGIWDIALIGTICVLVLCKIILIGYLLWRTLKRPSIAQNVIISVFVIIDLIVCLVSMLAEPEMRMVLIGCVLYRVFIIIFNIILITEIRKIEKS